jgi:hypothetical protein
LFFTELKEEGNLIVNSNFAVFARNLWSRLQDLSKRQLKEFFLQDLKITFYVQVLQLAIKVIFLEITFNIICFKTSFIITPHSNFFITRSKELAKLVLITGFFNRSM